MSRSASHVQSPLIAVDGTARPRRIAPPKVHESCPTCQGRGRIPREQCQPEMMALIPYGDKRLKPRRTKLIMAVTAVLTAVIIGATVALLYPKTVSPSITQGTASNLSLTCLPPPQDDQIATIQMNINWTMIVNNDNFVPVSLHHGHVVVHTIYNQLVGNVTFSSMSFAARKKSQAVLQVPVKISDRDATRIWKNNCVRGVTRPYNYFPLSFAYNASAHVLSASQSVTMSSLVLVACPIPSSPIGPPTPIPPNTTTTTTPPPSTDSTATTPALLQASMASVMPTETTVYFPPSVNAYPKNLTCAKNDYFDY